jgi:hypothetical protein
LLHSSSSSSFSSSSSAITIITRHIKYLGLHPRHPSLDSERKELAFSVLADAFMGGDRGEGAAWALEHLQPGLGRDLRTVNAVVAGLLLTRYAEAVAAAEAAIHRLLPSEVSLEHACSALNDGEGAGMSRYLPPFITLSLPWSVPWISACALQHAHTVTPP